jgi:Zn-dependent protease with chaperone function
VTASFFVRALSALLLTWGFYTLALAVALGLIGLLLMGVFYYEQALIPPIVLGAAALGGVVLTLWPRRAPLPDGVVLPLETQPALCALLKEVAQVAGQPLPDTVLLTFEVSAWVSESGRAVSRSSRTLALGFPLVTALSRAELRAVIAHEFAHYAQRDTWLRAWLRHTELDLGRTVEWMEREQVWLRWAFKAYARLFRRVVLATSRQQELRADAFAAQVAGPKALQGALEAMSDLDFDWTAFQCLELAPLLEAGFTAPIAEGFKRYRSQRGSIPWVRAVFEFPERYSTHPLLARRVAALNPQPPVVADLSDDPPLTLEDATGLERALVKRWRPELDLAPLGAVSWDAVPLKVHAERWRSEVAPHVSALGDLTWGALAVNTQRSRLLRRVSAGHRHYARLSDAQMTPLVVRWLGYTLCFTLETHGYQVFVPLAAPVRAAGAGGTLYPGVALEALWADDEAAWRVWCERAGIAGDRLTSGVSGDP